MKFLMKNSHVVINKSKLLESFCVFYKDIHGKLIIIYEKEFEHLLLKFIASEFTASKVLLWRKLNVTKNTHNYNQIRFLNLLLSILYNSINANENCGATAKRAGRRRKRVDIKNERKIHIHHCNHLCVLMCVYNHDQIIQIKLRTLIMSRCRRLKNGSFYGKFMNEINWLYFI